MTTKIRIKIGEVEVEYEGAEEFLDKKLLELIGQITKLAERAPALGKGEGADGKDLSKDIDPGTLASFLTACDAKSAQLKRFLATAEWLHRKGKKKMKTIDVTGALKENQQSRLGNASDCLNKNVSKGFCEKDGTEFYVTDEGRADLGLT